MARVSVRGDCSPFGLALPTISLAGMDGMILLSFSLVFRPEAYQQTEDSVSFNMTVVDSFCLRRSLTQDSVMQLADGPLVVVQTGFSPTDKKEITTSGLIGWMQNLQDVFLHPAGPAA